MSDTEATDAAAPEKKSKKKFVIIGVVLLLVGAAGYWFFLKPDGGKEEPVPGVVMVVDPVTVNLSGGGYLKVGVALQLTEDAAAHGEPSGAHAADLIIAEFSQADLSDVTGKRAEMQDSLEKKIVKAYHHTVIEIFYTEYVAQ